LTRPRTVCNVPGCPNLAVERGRCQLHQRQAWDGKRNFEGYKGDWLKIRAQVLKEEPICRRCRSRPSVTVDHIKPRLEGGSEGRFNLQGLCKICRRQKDAEDAARGKKRHAEKL